MASGSKARIAAAAVLIAGYAVTLGLSWPGHLSFDSIVQLHDGRFGFYHSWHPPVMAWLLGLGDRILPGTGLFVLFDAALLFAALLSLVWLRPRVRWLAVAVLLLCLPLPQLVLYQTIVWKDVLFANAMVAGFIALAQAEARWANAKARWAWVATAFASLRPRGAGAPERARRTGVRGFCPGCRRVAQSRAQSRRADRIRSTCRDSGGGVRRRRAVRARQRPRRRTGGAAQAAAALRSHRRGEGRSLAAARPAG